MQIVNALDYIVFRFFYQAPLNVRSVDMNSVLISELDE